MTRDTEGPLPYMETVASGGWNIEKSIFHFGRVPNSSGQTIVRGPGQRFE